MNSHRDSLLTAGDRIRVEKVGYIHFLKKESKKAKKLAAFSHFNERVCWSIRPSDAWLPNQSHVEDENTKEQLTFEDGITYNPSTNQ